MPDASVASEMVYIQCGNCRKRVWAHEHCTCSVCGTEFCVNCTPGRRLFTIDAAESVAELMFELRSCFQCVHRAALSRLKGAVVLWY
jgi:hypothetical protein